jgi:hypothetical protein
VNLQKLGRQLRREATASPKKTMVLGVLVLVAAWFWAPLIWGWTNGDDDSASAAAVASSASVAPLAATATQPAPSPVPPTTAQATVSERPRHPWQKLVEWMEADSRTLAATVVSDRRDPFHPPKTAVVQQESEEPSLPEPEQDVADVAPADVGLVLSSTIVGAHRRTARINGKGYEEGNTIEREKNGVVIRFQLTEIYPRRVVLTRNGKRFDLKIPSRVSPEEVQMLGKAD